MKKTVCVSTVLILLTFIFINSGMAVTLTSITIDPEDASGATTNAPGAWTTNTGDPLAQVGVKSEGVFVNQEIPGEPGTIGEIAIPLKSGINIFNLVCSRTFSGNAFYGAVLFFDGVATPPQIAVYNPNGTLDAFSVQPAGTVIMGGANGGLFFDVAPGTSVYVAPDGTEVEVLSFVINSMSSTDDEVSYKLIGPDGLTDTTAQLVLKVTRPDECECDLNNDGSCNMADWLLFGQDWGRTTCPVD